ncbi:MAG: substrate-binding domain-containing protein [Boseongicola sp.]|nr:MAG: substrate-binding domain-containing protein [Boseongicola sp.]
MRDIARVAGCSQPTVSFVLNKNETAKISDQMKQKVLDAARKLGYKTPAQPSNTTDKNQGFINGPIAFVIDTIATSPEGVHAYEGVLEAVKATGNIVLLAETQNDPVIEPKTLQYFIDQQVSAIVYACVFTRQITLPDMLQYTDIPVFLLNCYTEEPSHPAVIPADISGGHTATNALLDAGHTRIGLITGELFMECASGRHTGYRNALASADLPFAKELVVEGNWLPSSGYEGTKELMSLDNPPTAIFCSNDRMAVGCYEALKEMGLSIPEDVSVIGYDDDEIARHLSPQLTSMNLADRSMERWVIDQLFYGSAGNNRHPLTKLECELVERDSVAAPKGDMRNSNK